MLGAQCAPYGKGGVIGWFNPYDHMVLLLDGIKKSFLLYKIFRFIQPFQVHNLSESIQIIQLVLSGQCPEIPPKITLFPKMFLKNPG